MSRTNLPVQTIPRHGAIASLTFTAADASNDMEMVFTGREKIIAKVTSAGGARDVDFPTLTNDRTLNTAITKTLQVADNDQGIIGPFDPDAFRQSDGKLHIDITTDSGLTLAAFKEQ